MNHILVINSSVSDETSVSENSDFTHSAASSELEPDAVVTFRDIGKAPVSHLTRCGGHCACAAHDPPVMTRARSLPMSHILIGGTRSSDLVLGPNTRRFHHHLATIFDCRLGKTRRCSSLGAIQRRSIPFWIQSLIRVIEVDDSLIRIKEGPTAGSAPRSKGKSPHRDADRVLQ